MLVTRGTWVYPATSRTRKSSTSTPMVLGGRPPGRVGHCQHDLFGLRGGMLVGKSFPRHSRVREKTCKSAEVTGSIYGMKARLRRLGSRIAILFNPAFSFLILQKVSDQRNQLEEKISGDPCCNSANRMGKDRFARQLTTA